MWNDKDLLTLHGCDGCAYGRTVAKWIFSVSFLETHLFQDIGAPIRVNTNRIIYPDSNNPEEIQLYDLMKSKTKLFLFPF